MKKKLYIIRLSFALFVLALCLLAAFGLYPLHFLNLEFSPAAVRNIVNFSVVSAAIFLGILLFSLVFGRFYCSLICPFGIIQEVFALPVSKIYSKLKKKYLASKIYKFKYLTMALALGVLFGGCALVLNYLDPYTLFVSAFSGRAFAIVALALVLVVTIFKNRFFCANVCPVGAVVGLFSKISVFKNYMKPDICVSCGACARSCPVGCIDAKEKTVNNETCVKCLKCLSVCPKGAMTYGIMPKGKIALDLSKRNLLWLGATCAVFAGAWAMGLKFAKETSQKLLDAVLPAGAKNSERFLAYCLNCNLCVQNCPNKVLVKASKLAPVPHLDYTKGERHCKFDCNRCSAVCPSGAISKISLEDKQKTKIGTASIGYNCIGCSRCVRECPVGALEFVDYAPVVDDKKCIGCGKCKSVCGMGAITINPVKEQTVI